MVEPSIGLYTLFLLILMVFVKASPFSALIQACKGLAPSGKKTSPIISLLQNKFAFLEFIQTFNRCALLLCLDFIGFS